MGTREYKLANLVLIEEADAPLCFGCRACHLDSYDDNCVYALAEMGLSDEYCADNKVHFIQKP